MLEPNFTPFPTLETDRLVLRRIVPEDAKTLFDLRANKQVLRYIDRDGPTAVEEVEALIRKIDKGIDDNESIAWAITLRGDTTLIGTVTFWQLFKENYRAEAGYVLSPPHWGKGIASEALAAILHYGFYTMKLHSVQADVNPDNAASIRVLEKAGFVKEAHFRENWYYNGKFMDSAIYCLLAPERG